MTVRVAEPMLLALYAPPVQLRLNVSVPAAVGVTVFDPVAASVPLHAPLDVQVVPALAVQVTTADCPSVIEVGATARLTVEGGFMLDPPPFPPPQFATINPQRIPVTLRNAARLFCTLIPSERSRVARKVSAQRLDKGLIWHVRISPERFAHGRMLIHYRHRQEGANHSYVSSGIIPAAVERRRGDLG